MASAIILARENRVMIENMKEDLKTLGTKVETAFNHMSNRLPLWATILFTAGGSLIVGLITWAVTR